MDKELESFKYLFDESKITKINEHGSFYKKPSTAKLKDWHRKLVTLYSNDIEEIDMMDEIFLNPKFANPYISCMFICILGEKVRRDYANVGQEFRTRAYKSMVGHARVCGELGTNQMVYTIACALEYNDDYYNCYKANSFNPFRSDEDAMKTKKEALDIISECQNIRNKNKDDIVRYFHEKQMELKEAQENFK